MASIWVSRPDLEDLIGVDATQKLLTAFPGRSVYIPSKRNLDKLTPIIGPVAAEILRFEFGGCELMLPSAVARPRTLKDQILERLEQGRTYGQIVAELRCTYRHICGVAADAGMNPRGRAQKASTGTDGEA